MREGITLYGAANVDISKISNNSVFSKLTDEQRRTAILLGKRYTKLHTREQRRQIASGNIRSNGKHAYTGKGKVIVEESAKGKSYIVFTIQRARRYIRLLFFIIRLIQVSQQKLTKYSKL